MKTPSLLSRWRRKITNAIAVTIVAIALFFASDIAFPQSAAAYPFWAQQTAPETPREATGRLVCANCHLGAKPVEVEVPQSVLPDTVFKAVVEIPYDTSVQQVGADGSKVPLNVGAVLMLPEGFKIAPSDRISEELQEEVGDVFFQKYREDEDNVIIVGPLPGDEHQEIVFPVLSPDPETDSNIHYGKYAVHVGGNRGRGQIYPTGENTNNVAYKSTTAGKVIQISEPESGGYEVTIETAQGDKVLETIQAGPELTIAEGEEVSEGEVITTDPNVGGFGQEDTEIVLQSAVRIQGLLAFFALVILAQILLALKKKQVEKVQEAEINL